eukprot:PhM_4_TR1910/c1_g2_i1/m.31726
MIPSWLHTPSRQTRLGLLVLLVTFIVSTVVIQVIHIYPTLTNLSTRPPLEAPQAIDDVNAILARTSRHTARRTPEGALPTHEPTRPPPQSTPPAGQRHVHHAHNDISHPPNVFVNRRHIAPPPTTGPLPQTGSPPIEATGQPHTRRRHHHAADATNA